MPKKCTREWVFMFIYKLNRWGFVTFYYYLMPFLILVFQVILLYSNELYTQYQIKKKSERA